MSAYIVDPRTVDYLVAWANRRGHDHASLSTRTFWESWEDVPEEYRHTVRGTEAYGYRLELAQVSTRELGRILLEENVRSVAYRYESTQPENLPGPVDQSRVRDYDFRPIWSELQPSWVVSCCDCLRYQSCETPDYRESLAWAVTEAIREDAIGVLTEDAPWGVTSAELRPTVAAAD